MLFYAPKCSLKCVPLTQSTSLNHKSNENNNYIINVNCGQIHIQHKVGEIKNIINIYYGHTI